MSTLPLLFADSRGVHVSSTYICMRGSIFELHSSRIVKPHVLRGLSGSEEACRCAAGISAVILGEYRTADKISWQAYIYSAAFREAGNFLPPSSSTPSRRPSLSPPSALDGAARTQLHLPSSSRPTTTTTQQASRAFSVGRSMLSHYLLRPLTFPV